MSPTIVLVLAACTDASVLSPPAASVPADPSSPTAPATTPVATSPAGRVADLEVTFLGVGGYLLRFGDDVVMTPPMYTNPDFFATTLGTVASDPDLVRTFGADQPFEDVDGVLVGHAHYDHLLDLPTIWPWTDDATIYGNATMTHILAAFAPDRDPSCTEPAQDVQIPRERVVQLDDPDGALGHDLVDYRMCPDEDPGHGDGVGSWIDIPGTHVRFRALCSEHPDQIGPIHFAPGSVDADLCAPPDHADDWLEGLTIAYLVDFLDDDGVPVYRLYYQDAPTNPPVGMFAEELLEEKAVDVALLNVGNYTAVADAPGASLSLMSPRYTIGGHWEDFFRTQALPAVPIIGHDIDDYEARAEAALGEGVEAPVLVDGVSSHAREWVPDPGTAFSFSAE